MTKPLAKALGVAPEFLLDPPAVPDYRPSEYLVRQARAEGLEEGYGALVAHADATQTPTRPVSELRYGLPVLDEDLFHGDGGRA